MFYKNEPRKCCNFFFLCQDVFVMYFMIRISNTDKLTWIVLSNFALCSMCFMHISAVGFSPTESGFTTGTLTSNNRFLFQLQALWLSKSTSIFHYPKITAFSYSLFVKEWSAVDTGVFNFFISFHHHQMQLPLLFNEGIDKLYNGVFRNL